MHFLSIPKRTILATLILLFACLWSCNKKKSNDGGSSADPIYNGSPDGKDPINENETSNTSEENAGESENTPDNTQNHSFPPDKSLRLLTPEQFSNIVFQAFKFRMGSNSYWNRDDYFDRIVDEHGVALGGLDFEGAKQRDPTPSVQTLLVIRSLAWEIASEAVEEDSRSEEPVTFTLCKLKEDRPFMELDFQKSGDEQLTIKSSEFRWEKQLTHFFTALYGRTPTDTDFSDLKEVFSNAFQNEGSTERAWIVTIYTMLSTMELWNI